MSGGIGNAEVGLTGETFNGAWYPLAQEIEDFETLRTCQGFPDASELFIHVILKIAD
jgi:hypothetical protein